MAHNKIALLATFLFFILVDKYCFLLIAGLKYYIRALQYKKTSFGQIFKYLNIILNI